MALIQCPECGEDVSENAEACPNCGEPINGGSDGPSAGQAIGACGCIVALACAGLVFVLWMVSVADRVDLGADADGAADVCRQFVDDWFKDGYQTSYPDGMEDDASRVGKGRYRVSSSVEAVTEGGRRLQKRFDCVVQHQEGKTWNLVDLDVN